jgi:hypothetical protein
MEMADKQNINNIRSPNSQNTLQFNGEVNTLSDAMMEVGYYEYIGNRKSKTYKDLDRFYKSLPIKCSKKEFLKPLQAIVTQHLLKSYKLLEVENKDDAEIQEYYAEEFLKSSVPDMELAYNCLNKMKYKWSKEKFDNYHSQMVSLCRKQKELWQFAVSEFDKGKSTASSQVQQVIRQNLKAAEEYLVKISKL